MKKAPLADSSKINEFALKWLNFYSQAEHINNYVMEDFSFAEECWALGFDMDAGQALNDAIPDSNPLQDLEHLKACIDRIDSIQALGNGIFSQWRYWTHWSMDHPSAQDYEWFVVAFSRLAELTT